MLATALTRPFAYIAAYALPPRCPGCGVPVAADHSFCAACWSSFRFIAPPWCAGCNVPMPGGIDDRCARCLADPPRHAGVRAAVAYGPVASGIALRMKYGGRIGLATTCARAMARHVPDDADLLVPVPLHRWRLWRRGYNQALLLADELRTLTGVPVARDALIRRKPTPVLRGLGPKGRARAVAGAFAIPDPIAINQRRIVLVDDVHTSGATLDACARVLLAAGAVSVTMVCWARVLADD